MSSTGRGATRKEADFYATPPWTVHRFLEAVNLPGGRWLEPCAGDGELIRAVNAKRSDVVWSIGELRSEMGPHLAPLVGESLFIGDFLALDGFAWGPELFDVVLTNPPFGLALPFVKKCMELSKRTIMLLRLNFWGSEERREFLNAYPPDTYVLPNRPVFSVNKKGKVGTDSPEYAWFVWHSIDEYRQNPGRSGRIQVLGSTSKEERKEWSDRVRQLYAAQSCSAALSDAQYLSAP